MKIRDNLQELLDRLDVLKKTLESVLIDIDDISSTIFYLDDVPESSIIPKTPAESLAHVNTSFFLARDGVSKCLVWGCPECETRESPPGNFRVYDCECGTIKRRYTYVFKQAGK